MYFHTLTIKWSTRQRFVVGTIGKEYLITRHMKLTCYSDLEIHKFGHDIEINQVVYLKR